MKSIPDLSNMEAMAATGRRSVLMRARNEACELLRDTAVAAQSQDIASAGEGLEVAVDAIERLKEVARLWREVT